MHIVFIGNCQVQVLATIMRRFISPYVELELNFIDTYHPTRPIALEQLARADVVVAQQSLTSPPFSVDLAVAGHARVHHVPSVNGSFLYPNQGLPHPLKPVARYGNPPYPPEYNDRFLSKHVMSGTSPQDALSLYRRHDVAQERRVARLYELAREEQQILDSITGYECDRIIHDYLPKERVFQSAYHFSGRLARHIASTLCDRIGFDPKFGQRIRQHLEEAPFVARFVPVHPSVARYFAMEWVNETTLHEYMWEGSFTFDEYVLRYMEARWNPILQEGVIDAQRGDETARSKLEAGLLMSPNSALALHELSRIFERDGDIEQALVFQRRAAANGASALFSIRLGRLLQATASLTAARDAFTQACCLDPVSPTAWTLLRDVSCRLGETTGAALAGEEAAKFDVHPTGAKAALARIRDQLGAAAANGLT